MRCSVWKSSIGKITATAALSMPFAGGRGGSGFFLGHRPLTRPLSPCLCPNILILSSKIMDQLRLEQNSPPDSWVVKIEREAMNAILAAPEPGMEMLRYQFHHSQIVRREFSGAGFFSTFAVAPGAPRLARDPSLHLGTVYAVLDEPPIDLGFVLHVKEGVLDYFECFSFDDRFPGENDPVSYRLISP